MATHGLAESGVSVGDRAPEFHIADDTGRTVTLADLRGQMVLLAIFPAHWDPARPQQLALYNDLLSQVPGGARLVGVSCDGVWCELDVADQESVRFPLLRESSPDGELARQFGVQGQQAVFVIDGAGIVRWRHAGPVGVQPSMEEILQALGATKTRRGITRRELLVTAMAASLALTILPHVARAAGIPGQAQSRTKEPGGRAVTLNVNGRDYRLNIEPRVTVLDALRERIGLTGTKKGCDHGQCGACTVHVDGRRVNSCLMLAMQAEGSKIETVEGLARGEDLHPVQAAFIKHDGFQCGYCTSGQIMSAVACIHEGHAGDEPSIQEWMSGNICRCGAYPGIRAAIVEARDQMRGPR